MYDNVMNIKQITTDHIYSLYMLWDVHNTVFAIPLIYIDPVR
jgi:hypothetical protein